MTILPLNQSSPSMAPWQQLYERAVFERDHRRLVGRIAEARNAIYDRAEEVLTDSSTIERSVLNGALRTLRLLEDMATKRTAA